MFKDPPEGLIGEAWRILLAATKSKLLLPGHVHQYWKKHVAKWEGEEPVSDSSPGAPATGSPPSKRGKHGATSPEPPVEEPKGEASPLGLPPGPSAAGANAAPSPSSSGCVDARPSSTSQPAEADATNASPLAALANLAPCLRPGPSAASANAAPSASSPGYASARPSSASQPAEAEATSASPLAASADLAPSRHLYLRYLITISRVFVIFFKFPREAHRDSTRHERCRHFVRSMPAEVVRMQVLARLRDWSRIVI